MTPGIAKKDVEGVVSIARHLQEMQERKGLELTVSQNLPAELSQEADISDEAMYGLAETLKIGKKYMAQALKFHSGSIQEAKDFLKAIEATPSRKLKDYWLTQVAKMHWERVKQGLSQLGTGFSYTDLSNNRPSYYMGYDGNEHLSRLKKFLAEGNQRYFGFVYFTDTTGNLDVHVNLTAFTKRALPVISGLVRDITRTTPHVKSCDLEYDLKEDGEGVFNGLVGDPF